MISIQTQGIKNIDEAAFHAAKYALDSSSPLNVNNPKYNQLWITFEVQSVYQRKLSGTIIEVHLPGLIDLVLLRNKSKLISTDVCVELYLH